MQTGRRPNYEKRKKPRVFKRAQLGLSWSLSKKLAKHFVREPVRNKAKVPCPLLGLAQYFDHRRTRLSGADHQDDGKRQQPHESMLRNVDS